MTKQMAIRLDDALFERLKMLAEQTGRSASYYMREAVETHINDLEDAYLAEQALSEAQAAGELRFSLEEVKRELELED